MIRTARMRAGLLGLLPVLSVPGCAGPVTASVPLERSERVIPASELPPAAAAALREAAGERPFTVVEREDRGSFIAYEAEWLVEGVEHEATVLADGSLVETEIDVPMDGYAMLPSGVRERIDALQTAERDVEVSRRMVYLYDLSIDDAELLLRPDGTDARRAPRE